MKTIMVFDELENKSTLVELNSTESISKEDMEFYFDDKVRKAWHKQEEEWYFSIVDICAALTEQENARGASTYWAVLKKRLKEEGAGELLTNCKQLKMLATDGKMRKTGINSPKEYAALTNILTLAWSGKTVQSYKELKGLKKENLRDNMTNTELALNLLAEVSTTELSRMHRPSGYDETKEVTISGGEIAGNARKELEAKLGRTVISSSNANTPELLEDSKK